MTTDLTVGNPKKVLLAFTVPMLVSVMFQQLYNIADSVIAGKFINENALAAVGASYPITMIFMAIAIGSNVGCSVIVSQLFGAKKYRDMKTAVTTTFLSSSVLCLLLTASPWRRLAVLAVLALTLACCRSPEEMREKHQ